MNKFFPIISNQENMKKEDIKDQEYQKFKNQVILKTVKMTR